MTKKNIRGKDNKASDLPGFCGAACPKCDSGSCKSRTGHRGNHRCSNPKCKNSWSDK